MIPVRWSRDAAEDLLRLMRYIAELNPKAAEQLEGRIEASVTSLSEHPYLFRAGRVAGTREVVAHPNYVVVYRVLADCVEVTGVVHARQQYP